MTEARVAYQLNIFGEEPQIAAGVDGRCELLLREDPKAREDYGVAWVLYLARYHDLRRLLLESRDPVQTLIDLLALNTTPAIRTVLNRLQETMRIHPELRPPRAIYDLRQTQRRTSCPHAAGCEPFKCPYEEEE